MPFNENKDAKNNVLLVDFFLYLLTYVPGLLKLGARKRGVKNFAYSAPPCINPGCANSSVGSNLAVFN